MGTPDDVVELSDLERRIEEEVPAVSEEYQSGIAGRVSRSRTWRDAARQYEDHYELPEGLLTAVVAVESGGDPSAGSGKQARGVAQFIPVTAREHGLIVTDPKSDDPEKDQRLDPVRSIGAAARFYQKLLKRADGNVEAAHIMYNYGPGAYRTWLSNPSKKLTTETRNHLARLRAVRRYIEENP